MAGASSASERRGPRSGGRWSLAAVLGLALLAVGPVVSRAELEPAPPGVDASAELRRSRALLQSEGTYIEGTMTIAHPDFKRARTRGLRVWTDRTGDRSMVRVLSPARYAGTGFLEVRPNLWMFAPSVASTRRVPAKAMGEAFMESDWQIRDFFGSAKSLDDYDHRILGVEDAPPGHPGRTAYRIESIAKEASSAPWARILTWVEVEHGIPLRREYYDANGVHQRTLELTDIRAVQGRQVPYSWAMIPMGKDGPKKGRSSTIAIDEIRFEQTFSDELFTIRQLRAWP